MQNYGCNGNLLCYHGVVERNRISTLQSRIIIIIFIIFITTQPVLPTEGHR